MQEKNKYIYVGNQKLRCGYTTGSCATAAAKAATMMLLSGNAVNEVSIMTPKGILLTLPIVEITREEGKVSCAVVKDSGDDADVTNGVHVFATVETIADEEPSDSAMQVVLDGGLGIGRVTKPGLDQPVGNAAINTTPRKMILGEVMAVADEAEYGGRLAVTIAIPKGVELAAKTFNPRLGIEGGISILGTSGIVEPMSEKALVDTIRVEMRMLKEAGHDYLIVTPGNYGEAYLGEHLKEVVKANVKSSNFIGETIDMGYEFHIRGMLFIGHIGKMVKLAAGIMNTHSKYADGRMEVMVNAALKAGAGIELLKRLQECVTTDEALEVLEREALLEKTMAVIMERIAFHLQRRAYEGMQVEAIVFSNKFGYLGETKGTKELIAKLKKNK